MSKVESEVVKSPVYQGILEFSNMRLRLNNPNIIAPWEQIHGADFLVYRAD